MQEQVNFQRDDDEVYFVLLLDQHAWLDFYSANSLKLCSFSLMLRV